MMPSSSYASASPCRSANRSNNSRALCSADSAVCRLFLSYSATALFNQATASRSSTPQRVNRITCQVVCALARFEAIPPGVLTVMGEDLQELLAVVDRTLLKPGGQPAVVVTPGGLGQRGVGHFADQGVVERKLRLAGQRGSRSFLDQIALGPPGQRRRRLAGRQGINGADRPGPESPADHRSVLDHSLFQR